MTISRAELPGGGNNEDALIHRAVARHRKAVELGFDRAPDLAMTEPHYGERCGVPEARYAGTANDERHRFWALLLFPERTVWSFFYETFNLSEADAEARGQGLLESIRFGAF